MVEPKRIKKEMARDVAYVLGSPLHYRTKRAVLKNVLWAWTTFHGKYKGCRYWTPEAVEHLERRGIKGLRHEHTVPRKLLIEVLFQMNSPQEDDVFELLDRLAIGVVVTINEQKRLDSEHKTTMPPEFDDEQGDPWLRFKVCDIEVLEHPDWKGQPCTSK